MTMVGVSATQREWEDLARLDPLWSILTEKSKRYGRWVPAEFFASGRTEIDGVMRSCGFHEGNNGRALDFGCGAGRLSKALRAYFEDVSGVDISEEMVRLASKCAPECTFFVNQRSDLRLFPDDSFDFVYSARVLQHQRSRETAKYYIREFVRVAKPGGVVVFQMPFKLSVRASLQLKSRIYSTLRRIGIPPTFLYHKLGFNPMRTITLSERDVAQVVMAAKAYILRSYPDDFNQYSASYVVAKSRS